jgi:hypothetical protein
MTSTVRRALRTMATAAGVAVLTFPLAGTALADTPDLGLDEGTQQESSATDSLPSTSTTLPNRSGDTGLSGVELPGGAPGALPISYRASSDSDDCESYSGRNYSGPPGYNGQRKDDRKYDSDDYNPDCTGHKGPKTFPYNGYNGTDSKKQAENDYLLGGL